MKYQNLLTSRQSLNVKWLLEKGAPFASLDVDERPNICRGAPYILK
jgi:hypothetical protein